MAIFLLICVLFNIWFVYKSYRLAFSTTHSDFQESEQSSWRYQLLTYAVFAMALFDIPWVWLCMIQCFNNTFTSGNNFQQTSGDDSFGCKFMGWYSTFSLIGMMGSHCLVAFYLLILLRSNQDAVTAHEKKAFYETRGGFASIVGSLAVLAILIGTMPLMQGDGYRLTNGGFCYADFTNTTQSGIMLFFVLAFLCCSTLLWCRIGRFWVTFYSVFFVTWVLWVPATSYGIATGDEIPSPYMLIGAILGHGNALVNPVLYGAHLFRLLTREASQTEGGKKQSLAGDVVDIA